MGKVFRCVCAFTRLSEHLFEQHSHPHNGNEQIAKKTIARLNGNQKQVDSVEIILPVLPPPQSASRASVANATD